MKKEYKHNVKGLKMNIRHLLSVKDTTMTNDRLQVGLDYIEDTFIKLKADEKSSNATLSDILEKGQKAEDYIKNKIEKEQDLDFHKYSKKKSKYKKRVLKIKNRNC